MTPVQRQYALVAVLAVIATTINIGCKKGHHGDGPDEPDKKAIVTTLAGDGTDDEEDGPALSAKFHTPADVAVAPDGTVYVVDYNGHRVRKIAGGQVTTLAGSDSTGIINGNGAAARFRDPYRIAVDPAGNCYVIDQVDPRIRKVTPNGDVTTYAGMNAPGFADGPAASAQFLINAEGLASDEAGNIYLGDTFNQRVRAVSRAAEVSTAAGDGTEGLRNGNKGAAEFRYPSAVTCDKQNNIYVVDQGNLVIRKITPGGVVSTFAGSGKRGTADGDALTAQFDQPLDLVADARGNIYIIDSQRIRKVTPKGKVTTVAGSVEGYEDGEGADAKFRAPFGLGIDAAGNLFVADANNNRIRKITFQ